MVTGSGTAPRYLADKKDGKVNKGIFDIHDIDVYFTSVYSNPSVFDTSSVAKISNSKRELQNEQRLIKGEVMMCVGNDSKADKITIATPFTFGISVEPKINVIWCFALSMNMIGSCLLQYGYSFKVRE